MVLKRVPVKDRMWLMAQLTDTLNGDDAMMPVGPQGAPNLVAQSPVDEQLPAGTSLVIHTSGSSGVPKFVALSAAAIKASAVATNEHIGGAGQWLIALPTHLISGLQMLTRSILAETEPVFIDGKFKAADFIKRAQNLETERRYTSLVPVQLSQLLDYVDENPKVLHILQRFNKILVGGQATPLTLRQRAHENGINITRTYGMTETAGGLIYDGVEIGDARVRVRDGEVQLSGSMLALGYIGDNHLTSEKFVTDNNTRWFRTGDEGNLLGGMLTVTGRQDRVIVTGGTNVSLDEVERIATEIPNFEGAVAVSAPDAKWGNKVLLATDKHVESIISSNSFHTLQNLVRERLGEAAVPRALVQVERIYRLEGGKPDLRAIRTEVLEILEQKT